jgi:hypothetical protein
MTGEYVMSNATKLAVAVALTFATATGALAATKKAAQPAKQMQIVCSAELASPAAFGCREIMVDRPAVAAPVVRASRAEVIAPVAGAFASAPLTPSDLDLFDQAKGNINGE